MVNQSPIWLPSVDADGQQWSGSLVVSEDFGSQRTTTSLQSGVWLWKQDVAQPSWTSEQLTNRHQESLCSSKETTPTLPPAKLPHTLHENFSLPQINSDSRIDQP